jgi:hypothetical protein
VLDEFQIHGEENIFGIRFNNKRLFKNYRELYALNFYFNSLKIMPFIYDHLNMIKINYFRFA